MDQIDVSYFAKTKAEALDFSDRVSAIANMVYQSGFQLDQTLMQTFGMQKKDAFLSLLRDHKVSTESHSDLKNFLTKIQETTLALPTLSLTLAFQPTEQTLETLSRWFMLNIKKQVLFDITVDPKIIAGMLISYQGKYLDFTIKQSFVTIVTQMLSASPQTAPAANSNPAVYHNPENMHV